MLPRLLKRGLEEVAKEGIRHSEHIRRELLERGEAFLNQVEQERNLEGSSKLENENGLECGERLEKGYKFGETPDIFKQFEIQHNNVTRLERTPTVVYRNVLNRFLERSEYFNNSIWQSLDNVGKKQMIRKAYEIFAEELNIPVEKVKDLEITYEKSTPGEMAAYRYVPSVDKMAQTITPIIESININTLYLKESNLYEALNSIYHETIHQFQMEVMSKPDSGIMAPYRKEWYEDTIKQLEQGTQGDSGTYYSLSDEMFAHQQADYFSKTFEALQIERGIA